MNHASSFKCRGNCSSCPTMAGGKHTHECEANKAKMDELDKMRKKRAARSLAMLEAKEKAAAAALPRSIQAFP